MTEDTIKKICYTKAEVDAMVAEAVEEARRIDLDPGISGRGNEDHPLSSRKLKGLPGSADHDPGPAPSVFRKNWFRESDQHDRLEDGGNG